VLLSILKAGTPRQKLSCTATGMVPMCKVSTRLNAAGGWESRQRALLLQCSLPKQHTADTRKCTCLFAQNL